MRRRQGHPPDLQPVSWLIWVAAALAELGRSPACDLLISGTYTRFDLRGVRLPCQVQARVRERGREHRNGGLPETSPARSVRDGGKPEIWENFSCAVLPVYQARNCSA